MSTTETEDFVDASEFELTTVDRSTVERYSVCPAQARYVETGAVNNSSGIASAGQAVHEAFSYAISSYIDSQGAASHTELVETIMTALLQSRPDIQPEALKAARSSVWPFARYVTDLHFLNILRYDGGEGNRSGQLAWDIPSLGIRLTSELDFLHAGPSKQVLHEVDYKTGWKIWSAADVADSFQFALHAWLVLNNYPEVQALEVKIWNSRTKRLTWPVEYERNDLPEIEQRIFKVAMLYAHHSKRSPEQSETWPAIEKCAICPAAALCPCSGQDIADVATDPGAFVERIVALDAKLSSMKKLAGAYVDRTGKDIVSDTGAAFGAEKPKSGRKPLKSVYSIKGKGDDDGEETA